MDLSSIYAHLQQQTKELMNHPFHPLWNQLNLMSAIQQMPTNSAAATALLQQQAQMAQVPSNPYALPGYGVDFNAWAMTAGLSPMAFNSPNVSNNFPVVNSPTPSPPFALSYPNTPTPDYHHLNLINAQKLQAIHPQQQLYGTPMNHALMFQSAMTPPVDEQGVAIYPCNMCDKRFQKPWHLRTHLAGVHYQLRPHKCPECPMAFRSPYDLKRHQTTHTGERFECDHCNISFGSKQRIAKHIRENPSCWIDDEDIEDHPTCVTGDALPSSAAKDPTIAAHQTPLTATQPDMSSSTALIDSQPPVSADMDSSLPPPDPQSLQQSVVSDTDSDNTRVDYGDDDDELIIADI